MADPAPEAAASGSPAVQQRRRDLVPPSVWFDQDVTHELWMPESRSLSSLSKNSRSPGVAATLVNSWFVVKNYTDRQLPAPWWAAHRLPGEEPLDEELAPLSELLKNSDDAATPPNSMIKIQLYPTHEHRLKLEQMFATHRAVYNKAIARSREACKPQMVVRPCKKRKRAQSKTGKQRKQRKQKLKEPKARETFMSIAQLQHHYRGIATASDMGKYFRNRRALARYLLVNEEVRDGAFRVFTDAIKSSRALYYALKKKDKKTTFPEMKFKSKFARSNSIVLRKRNVSCHPVGDRWKARFHPIFFGFKHSDRNGIEIREPLPVLEYSVRLQRLREGHYFLAVPRLLEWEPSESDRVCAIDPGVRQFLTLYDPDGRVLSVKDESAELKRQFDAIDFMQFKLSTMDARLFHTAKVPSKLKKRACKGQRREKTFVHRQRQRLRRRIRFTYRRVTRLVDDMHHKLASWLADNYECVLLPSFQTAEMVRKYEQQDTVGGTPPLWSPAPSERRRKQKDQNVLVEPRTRRNRVIRNSTARAMLAQSHYRFKMLLKYKMERVGGRLIVCEEEYTTKTCSWCGAVNPNVKGKVVFRCPSCYGRLDRDVNAARNILIKNRELLA